MANENPSAFKHWISPAVVQAYAQGLKKAWPDFDTESFLEVQKTLEHHELKGRVRLIAYALKKHLQPEYKKALNTLLKSIRIKKIEGFSLWPATEFIQLYGTNDFDHSFAAMRELTQKFTAEFAVRPFIIKNQTKALKELKLAAKSKNTHLRRWASEGSRPRLPWGERLHQLVKNPLPTIEILEILKFDPELYVRKSVSNHLNDIAKDHPMLVIQTLSQWKKQVPTHYEKEFRFILNRSLRTLIKAGHPRALELVGITHGHSRLNAQNFKIKNKMIKTGQKIEFSFDLINQSKQSIQYVIDYVIHHKKANGTLSPKVFKLKSGIISPKKSLKIKKNHSFKPITTRVYYSGEHKIEILVNGKKQLSGKFKLLVS